jgi:hypothetical protein
MINKEGKGKDLNLRPLGYEPSSQSEYGVYTLKSAGGSTIFTIFALESVTKIITKKYLL